MKTFIRPIILVASLLTAPVLMAGQNSICANTLRGSSGEVGEILREVADYYESQKYTEARRSVDRGLKLEPSSGSLLAYSASLHSFKREWRKALAQAQEAHFEFESLMVCFAKQNLDPIMELGDQYSAFGFRYYLAVKTEARADFQLGNPRAAIKYFLLFEELWPDRIGKLDLGFLADAYQITGDYENSALYYKKTREAALKELGDRRGMADGDRRRIFIERPAYNLVIAYDKLGKYQESSTWFDQLLKEASNQNYWLEKMKKDDDYNSILKRDDIQVILENIGLKER